jgi:small subunit ribosomal protein S7
LASVRTQEMLRSLIPLCGIVATEAASCRAINACAALGTSSTINSSMHSLSAWRSKADVAAPEVESSSVDPVKILLQAIDNVRPLLEVRSMKVAARVVYIPIMVHPKKQRSVAVRWLVHAAQARQRSSKAPMAECLALEVLLAYQRKGSARQRRDELHQLAVQNKANMQMRWW